jgi:prevent-host-death family protein
MYRFPLIVGSMGKTIGAAEFKAACLRIIDEMNRDGEPVIVTKRGKPVAVLSPVATDKKPVSIWGAMRGTVLRYDDPFAPATDPNDWDAVRETARDPD